MVRTWMMFRLSTFLLRFLPSAPVREGHSGLLGPSSPPRGYVDNINMSNTAQHHLLSFDVSYRVRM